MNVPTGAGAKVVAVIFNLFKVREKKRRDVLYVSPDAVEKMCSGKDGESDPREAHRLDDQPSQ